MQGCSRTKSTITLRPIINLLIKPDNAKLGLTELRRVSETNVLSADWNCKANKTEDTEDEINTLQAETLVRKIQHSLNKRYRTPKHT